MPKSPEFLMVQSSNPKFGWPLPLQTRHQQSTPAVAFLMAGAKTWPAVEVREMGNGGFVHPKTSHFNRGNYDELTDRDFFGNYFQTVPNMKVFGKRYIYIYHIYAI